MKYLPGKNDALSRAFIPGTAADNHDTHDCDQFARVTWHATKHQKWEDETLEILKQAKGSIWQRQSSSTPWADTTARLLFADFSSVLNTLQPLILAVKFAPPCFLPATSVDNAFLTERVLVIDGYSHLLHTYTVLLALHYILYTDNCRSIHPTVTQWNLQMVWSSCLCSQDCCCTTALLFWRLWTGMTPPAWTSVWAKAKWSELAAADTTDPWKPSLLRSINTQLLFLTTSWDFRPTQRISSRDAVFVKEDQLFWGLQGNPYDSPLLLQWCYDIWNPRVWIHRPAEQIIGLLLRNLFLPLWATDALVCWLHPRENNSCFLFFLCWRKQETLSSPLYCTALHFTVFQFPCTFTVG